MDLVNAGPMMELYVFDTSLVAVSIITFFNILFSNCSFINLILN